MEKVRPIDANSLIGFLHNQEFIDGDDRSRVYRWIEEQPTIESKVRHGRWENGKCTNCKRNLLDLCGGEDYELAMYAEFDADFCPFCGARMDGGDD